MLNTLGSNSISHTLLLRAHRKLSPQHNVHEAVEIRRKPPHHNQTASQIKQDYLKSRTVCKLAAPCIVPLCNIYMLSLSLSLSLFVSCLCLCLSPVSVS